MGLKNIWSEKFVKLWKNFGNHLGYFIVTFHSLTGKK